MPVVIADQRSIIVYVIHRFEEIFLWTYNEIVGKPITIIIPPELHDAHNLGFSRFLSTEQSTILGRPIKLKAIKKNGEVIMAEHTIHGEKMNGTWSFVASIRPLDEGQI